MLRRRPAGLKAHQRRPTLSGRVLKQRSGGGGGGTDTAAAKMPQQNRRAPPNVQALRERVEAQSKRMTRKIRLDKTKYDRLRKTKSEISKSRSKRVKKAVAEVHEMADKSAEQLASAELMLTAEPGFAKVESVKKPRPLSQAQLLPHVDLQSQQKIFELKLDKLGPYRLDFSRNGQHLLLAGQKGHIGLMHWQDKQLLIEQYLNETVRAVKFLHNETMFAVAQKKRIYVYDKQGTELHCLQDLIKPRFLDFLPYHWLLVASTLSHLQYFDSSIGSLVWKTRTGLAPTQAMRQNPWNAVMCLGHANGVVSLWTPNTGKSAASILAHRAGILSLDVDTTGTYMVTSSVDSIVRVWDVRTYKQLQQYYLREPARAVSISQRGLIAAGGGSSVTVWKDALATHAGAPYMTHRAPPDSSVVDLAFCPFEDFLGIGHITGYMSVAVPGAGEPNFDSYVANPFETGKQRREAEVHSLLEKLPASMITLDPNMIGRIANQEEDREQVREAWKERVADTASAKPETRKNLKRQARKKHLEKEAKNDPRVRLQRHEDAQSATKAKQHAKAKDEDMSLSEEEGGWYAEEDDAEAEAGEERPRRSKMASALSVFGDQKPDWL
eukprot:TRINITY_DN18315_c0_g1_i1.p1 TRINITY_DN18315_c0_g1~~TRINITY_DN18315_c0_g1_i1.p1  ORF type:complete len:620 (+),score=173.90 TRINITY_DN18315_c0_g1_i1:32-1861(+)